MRLKEIRSEKKLTQDDVAHGIGCSTVVYSRYERGERQPSLETLIKLSNFFNVSTDYLLEITDVADDPTTQKIVTVFTQLNEDNKDIIIGKAKELLREQRLEEKRKAIPSIARAT